MEALTLEFESASKLVDVVVRKDGRYRTTPKRFFEVLFLLIDPVWGLLYEM